MAFSCRRLYLFRKAGSSLQTLEPAGTDVRQIAVSRTRGFGQRLFWTVASADGSEVVKSLVI